MPAHLLVPSRLAEQAVPSRRWRSRSEAIQRLREQAAYLRVRLRAVPGHESLLHALEQRGRSLERLAETEARLEVERVMAEAERGALRDDVARASELAQRLGTLAAEAAQLEARWWSERRAFTEVKRRLDHRVAARFHAQSPLGTL